MAHVLASALLMYRRPFFIFASWLPTELKSLLLQRSNAHAVGSMLLFPRRIDLCSNPRDATLPPPKQHWKMKCTKAGCGPPTLLTSTRSTACLDQRRPRAPGELCSWHTCAVRRVHVVVASLLSSHLTLKHRKSKSQEPPHCAILVTAPLKASPHTCKRQE